jgi:hypothetical protein
MERALHGSGEACPIDIRRAGGMARARRAFRTSVEELNMKTSHPLLVALFAASVSFALVGCDLFDSGGSKKSSTRTTRRSDDGTVISSGGASRGDARGTESIPSRADRVAEGTDQRLTYTAPTDGTLYVYDASDKKLLFSGPLYRNEEFLLNPTGNVIDVNGRKAGTYNLHTDHRYELYFDRDSASRDSRRSSDRF